MLSVSQLSSRKASDGESPHEQWVGISRVK